MQPSENWQHFWGLYKTSKYALTCRYLRLSSVECARIILLYSSDMYTLPELL